MRVMDGLLCFPPILLGIFVVTFLGPSLREPDPGDRRPLRPRASPGSCTRARSPIRELEYVESARALGASAVRVVAGTILPNIVAPILVQASLAARPRHPARVGPVVPGPRAATADSIVGAHGRAVGALHAALSPAAPLALGGDLSDRARVQPPGATVCATCSTRAFVATRDRAPRPATLDRRRRASPAGGGRARGHHVLRKSLGRRRDRIARWRSTSCPERTSRPSSTARRTWDR